MVSVTTYLRQNIFDLYMYVIYIKQREILHKLKANRGTSISIYAFQQLFPNYS